MARKKKSVSEASKESVIFIDSSCMDNNPQMDKLLYDGNNAKEVMEFCGAYHMECKPLSLYIYTYIETRDKKIPHILIVNVGQFVVKDSDVFKVVNNV
jgi:hypothetical protein